jgi:hypothetical protein
LVIRRFTRLTHINHHNSVTADAVEKFLNKKPSNHVNVLDARNGATCRQYGVDVFPSYFLIGPDGKIVVTSNEDREVRSRDLIKSLRQFLNANGNLAKDARRNSKQGRLSSRTVGPKISSSTGRKI